MGKLQSNNICAEMNWYLINSFTLIKLVPSPCGVWTQSLGELGRFGLGWCVCEPRLVLT